jgi:hypothetical protein
MVKVLVNAASISHIICYQKFVYYNRTLLTTKAQCTNKLVAQAHYTAIDFHFITIYKPRLE